MGSSRVRGEIFQILQLSLQLHKDRLELPRACWGGYPGNCAQARVSQLLGSTLDEVMPDGLILGLSADTGGKAGHIMGAEDLLLLDPLEIEAFLYSGPAVNGFGGSADGGAYVGGVWNLDCIDCYRGTFWVFSVDLSLGEGAEVTFFGEPGSYPFSGGVWGVAASPGTNAGFGASATFYKVEYVRHGEFESQVLKPFWQNFTTFLQGN